MIGDNPNRRPVVAAIAATFLGACFGLTYHALAARLGAPVSSIPVPPDALERFPMQIGAGGARIFYG